MARALFIASFIINVLLTLGSAAVLPARVAIHFGRGGMADGWASNTTNVVIFLTIHTLLFLSFLFSPRLIAMCPASCVNLPNKDYWLTPGNRPRAEAMISAVMWQFGAAMFMFMLAVSLLTIQANLSDPVQLNEKIFLIVLGSFLLYTGIWCVGLFRIFRVPPGE